MSTQGYLILHRTKEIDQYVDRVTASFRRKNNRYRIFVIPLLTLIITVREAVSSKLNKYKIITSVLIKNLNCLL